VNAPQGTEFSDDASCTGGKVIGGGGGVIATADGTQNQRIQILQSSPISTTVWRVVGVVDNTLTSGETAVATATAVCVNP
jgi:hypothetical protein